jgi:hypothetical protein
MVTRSNATVIEPFRSVRVALFTELTTPRIVEPAGTSTRLRSSRRSTMVVASKRSSTCAVFELSVLASRTSNSVPTGISLGFCERPTVPTPEVGDDDGRSSPMPTPDGVDLLSAASPRARLRMLSTRSRTSA